jgi:hypothetical protein
MRSDHRQSRERVYLQSFQQIVSQDSSFYPSWQFLEITVENLSTAIGVLERPLEGSLVARLYPFVPAISGGKQSSHH